MPVIVKRMTNHGKDDERPPNHPQHQQQQRRVYFLNSTQLEGKDYFSATWIQPVSNFVTLDLSRVRNVEAGCFAVFATNRGKVFMTLDWFDFSVQHLSKWWKVLGVPEDDTPYNMVMSKFQEYIQRVQFPPKNNETQPMARTIAVIAFQQWKHKTKSFEAKTLTTSSLAATMASLIQAGFGRVVVVGYEDSDAAVVQDAFRILAKNDGESTTRMIGSTEIAYVQATAQEVTSQHTQVTLVKASLEGLQNALRGNIMTQTRAKQWLGSRPEASEYYKYVYLTEPDSLLQTRPSTLSQLKDALDKGMILTPHRLQPLPHESDVTDMTNDNKFVPATGSFAHVIELNALKKDSCCDEQRGAFKPWKKYGKCESSIFWWQCGFNRGNKDHSRLEEYQLMRLQSGMTIVTLAGTEHGRRCVPSSFGCVPSADKDKTEDNGEEEAVSVKESDPEVAAVEVTHRDQKVDFIPSHLLGKLDYFSATWIQPVTTFLKLDTNEIVTVESGVFRVWKENLDRMRMTLDWLDFSVEHLSKYWKNAQVFREDPLPYNFITSSLEGYIEKAQLEGNATALEQTFAVIAFQPYGNRGKPNEARNLTVLSLAATMASMMQAGIGRILVVGYDEDDSSYARESFAFLRERTSEKDDKELPITRIGKTEVGYARATLEEVTSKITPVNRVKGSLTGLQRALKGKMDEERKKEWLGRTHKASFWKYVYLTEPDTILQARPSALPQIQAALDKGMILAPHRFQPLPHESDLKGMENENKFIPATGKFETVVKLNPLNGGVCCDGLEGESKPYMKFDKCGSFWWQCGFNARRDHSRLEEYQLMRLTGAAGTGIVNLAGSEHGRRCIPNTSGVCSLSSATG